MLNHSAATFSSPSDSVDAADPQPKAVKGKGKTVQPAAKRARTKAVTVLGDDPDDEAAKDRSETWNTVLCVWACKLSAPQVSEPCGRVQDCRTSVLQNGSSGEATLYLEANDEEKWNMLVLTSY
ncbi:hypothetical protein WJX77_005283 [Trebouxia sp. C0004]